MERGNLKKESWIPSKEARPGRTMKSTVALALRIAFLLQVAFAFSQAMPVQKKINRAKDVSAVSALQLIESVRRTILQQREELKRLRAFAGRSRSDEASALETRGGRNPFEKKGRRTRARDAAAAAASGAAAGKTAAETAVKTAADPAAVATQPSEWYTDVNEKLNLFDKGQRSRAKDAAAAAAVTNAVAGKTAAKTAVKTAADPAAVATQPPEWYADVNEKLKLFDKAYHGIYFPLEPTYHDGTHYIVLGIYGSFDQLKHRCNSVGSGLATFKNKKQLADVANRLKTRFTFPGDDFFFIGLNYENLKWKWLDGSPGPPSDWFLPKYTKDPIQNPCAGMFSTAVGLGNADGKYYWRAVCNAQ